VCHKYNFSLKTLKKQHLKAECRMQNFGFCHWHVAGMLRFLETLASSREKYHKLANAEKTAVCPPHADAGLKKRLALNKKNPG
jgi:hypothetical protein